MAKGCVLWLPPLLCRGVACGGAGHPGLSALGTLETPLDRNSSRDLGLAHQMASLCRWETDGLVAGCRDLNWLVFYVSLTRVRNG